MPILKKLKSKKALYIFLAVLTASAFLFGSFYLGYKSGEQKSGKLDFENIANKESPEKISADFRIFWEAWNLLKKEHLRGASAQDQDFIYGAITGLAGSLKDPHTVFFPPEDSKKFEEDVNGNFGGIGAEIGIRNNQLIVIAPLKNTPAEKAGLKADDKILAIDEKNTDGVDVNEAVKKIRGEIGTDVILTVFRDGWLNPKDIKIMRANI